MTSRALAIEAKCSHSYLQSYPAFSSNIHKLCKTTIRKAEVTDHCLWFWFSLSIVQWPTAMPAMHVGLHLFDIIVLCVSYSLPYNSTQITSIDELIISAVGINQHSFITVNRTILIYASIILIKKKFTEPQFDAETLFLQIFFPMKCNSRLFTVKN